jgi:LysR family glycine cleavage system transcriptional activator
MIDWHSLPPLTALRAFSALSDAGSVVEAGAQLNVSHAAISQQLKALETHMGIALVDRSARAMVLTPEGQHLAEALRVGFGAIFREVEALTGANADRPLQISTTQLFATTWLMPRMRDFQDKHPGVDVMINPSTHLCNPEAGGIDVGLRFGMGQWAGLETEMLVPTNMVVTAAPDLVGERDFDSPADLLCYPWLQELGTSEARDWLHRHGVIDGRCKSVTHVPGNLMLDGARSGQGIILTASSAVQPDVDAGRLRILFRDAGDTGYFIVTRPGVHRAALKVFLTWLRKQVAR